MRSEPVAVLLPGAGSSADFLRRAFGGPLRAAGYVLEAVEPVPGPGVVAAGFAALDAAAARLGPRLGLVGGVSLGAHVAARWAAARTPPPPARDGRPRPCATPAPLPAGRLAAGGPDLPRPDLPRPDLPRPDLPRPDLPRPDLPRPDLPPDTGADRPGAGPPAGAGAAGGPAAVTRGGWARPGGVLLALPAWTGAPGAVATVTAGAADQVTRLGIAGAVAAARSGGVDWVAAELAAAWPTYGDLLAATLRAAAAAPGPTAAELRRLDLPVGLVACTDDPLHPAAVADRWAGLLPRAAVRRLRLADLAAERSALGTAALAALADAR